MITLFLRAVTIYVILFAFLRLMGKRQLSELQPFEFVITLLIADLAQTPMSNTGEPFLYGLVPMTALFLTQQLLSLLAFKSGRVRHLIGGKPSIVIENGCICEAELKRTRYTVGDLLEQLRTQGYNMADIAFAILETDGELSIVPHAHKRTVTTEDLNIEVEKATLPRTLVLDGMIQKSDLSACGYDESWLEGQFAKMELTLKGVLFAGIIEHTLVVQPKHESRMVMERLKEKAG